MSKYWNAIINRLHYFWGVSNSGIKSAWRGRIVGSNVGKSGNNDEAVIENSALHRNYKLALLSLVASIVLSAVSC